MALAAVLVFALTAAAPAAPADEVSSFRCGTTQAVSMARWATVDAAFLKRSVAIIAASLAGDSAVVTAFTSPEVQTTYFPYDAGVTLTGRPALIELIRKTAPRDYEWVSGRGLPPPMRPPCGTITVTLTLVPAKRDMASIATFKYQAGLLVDFQVNDADYSAGHLPPPRR